MIRYRDHAVSGFALEGRAERLRATLHETLDIVEEFTRSLTPREAMILRLGLAASHMEESVAHGDWTRAEAHAESISRLLDQLGGQRGAR
jgi:hypothetical protein